MMSKLADMLGRAEDDVKKLIDGLEAKTGFTSIDVSFLAAHHQDVRRAIANLGLDPEDTTGPELYHALQAKFNDDSVLLDRSLGVTGPLSDDQKMASVQKLINVAAGKPEAWAIKASALKAILSQLPPTKTRKRLGYRSLESMLKRQEPGVICYLARQLESPTWQTKLNKALAKSGSTSFEMRPVKFLISNELDGVKAEPISGTILLSATDLGKHSVLSLSLAVFNELEKISRTNKRDLAKAVPMLAWWQKLEHLSAVKNDQAVSLNVKDVAHNWANKLSYYEQVGTHAADLIMQNLMGAYAAKPEWAAQEAVVETSEPAPQMNELAKEIVEV